MRKGRLFLLTSAIIYGLVPVLANQVYKSGSDGVTLVFLRSILSLPLLLFIIWKRKIGFKLSKKELKDSIIVSCFGNAPAMVLLYAAYSIGSVGVSSMLHFCYPFIIVIVMALLFKERLSRRKWLGVAAAAFGVLLSLDMKTDTVSAVLAVLSGAFYAFFVIYMDRSGIDKMNYWRLTFFISAGMSVAAFLMCITGDGVKLPYTISGWISAFAVSLLTTLIAIPLFQRGVEIEGAAEAGIISMAEPVVSILSGVLVFGEKVTVAGGIGCALIAVGIWLVESNAKRRRS
ncbi:MAG: EamA family transporter [Clostridia bacterium]|nr:EamA family transporter [Clostridia bacterium]MBQ8637383.1 EamA family transporter [Clostridia bacterium]